MPADAEADKQGALDNRSSRPWMRFAGFLLLFIVLTAFGICWATPNRDVVAAAWHHFRQLPTSTHLALIALALSLIGAEMLRLYVFGRAIGEQVGFRAALDATIANNFFSWLTPGAALGEPASTYVLTRHGLAWDAAVLISFAKFATSFVLILGVGLVLIFLGLGPPLPVLLVIPLATAVAIGAGMMLILVVGAFAPQRACRGTNEFADWLRQTWVGRSLRVGRAIQSVAEVAVKSMNRLAAFRRAGGRGAILMLTSHLVYYGVFVAIMLVLADAFGAKSLGDVAPIAIVYQGFLYLAPTPGGSALGEASADVFFGGVVPGEAAFAVVILFRSLTFYFHVALGLLYLPIIGALGPVVKGLKAKN